MSSPGTSKTSRPMTPLPKDYHTAVAQMETNNLLRSTLTEDCRTQKGDQKTCLLCGLSYFWRPSRCRTHLGLEGSTKMVQVCKPYPEHCDRFSEVVRELRERDTQPRSCVSVMGCGGVTWDSCTISCCNSTSFTRHALTVYPRK
jgi:hypothetical protein